MLGKLGDILNKDVGAIVKDAGKVLNADVGDIVKGAGKVLTTDVGALIKDKPGQPIGNAEQEARLAAEAKAAAIAAAMGKAVAKRTAAPAVRADVTPNPDAGLVGDKTMTMKAFDPDATLQLNTPPLQGYEPPRSMHPSAPAPTATSSAIAANSAAAVPILNDETTQRARRSMPNGTGLGTLLPYEVGDFSRPQSMPTGDIASDTVSANYGSGGETVVVKLALCWDADEAREPLERLAREAGDKVRMAPDRTWVLAETAQGVTFAWTREAYSYSASSARGLGPLTRFLWAFPY